MLAATPYPPPPFYPIRYADERGIRDESQRPRNFPESSIDVYTSISDMSKPLIPALPCMCASLRRASRALTQRYDDALRPLGLTITQFTILQALSLAGEISQGR